MCGTRNDVATKLLHEESRALYTHCYAHAFNLSVADTVKSKLCSDALDTAFEVNRLIKFSQKRNAAFEKIRCSHQEGTPTPVDICTSARLTGPFGGTPWRASLLTTKH